MPDFFNSGNHSQVFSCNALITFKERFFETTRRTQPCPVALDCFNCILESSLRRFSDLHDALTGP